MLNRAFRFVGLSSKFVALMVILSVLGSVGPLGMAFAERANHAADAAAEDEVARYPLTYCVVSGAPLGSMGEPVRRVHAGREAKFCCAGCIPQFEADPAAYFEEVDAALIKDQRALYPLDACVVSGRKLTDDAVEFLIGDRLYRTCSQECRQAVESAPTAYRQKLDAATIAAQRESYALDVCPVSGMELGSMGPPHEYVYQGRLVRFCCAGCVDGFESNPGAALEQIDKAQNKMSGH